MNLTHAIITRYNVGLYSDNPYNVRDAEGWMQARWALFTQTANSVYSQTVKGTEWILIADPQTPESWLYRMRGNLPYPYTRRVVFSDSLGVRSAPDLQLMLRVIATQWNNADYLLTTRLDNDDILLPGFVAAVQQEARRRIDRFGVPLVIDTHGYKFYVGNGERVKDPRSRANSTFLSLAEPVTDAHREGADFLTCYARPHAVMPNDYPAFKVADYLYEMVIHGRNQMNR